MIIKGEGEWVEIPHEPRNELRIRALTWREIKSAKEERSREAIASMREMGADLMQALPKRDAADSIIDAALADPLESYSQAALLEYGVTGWRGPEYDDTPFDISLLDLGTAEWAAREAYRRSRVEGADAGKSHVNSAPTTEGKAATPTRSD